MIYAIVNNKGGEGKSTISFQVLPLLVDGDFEIVEIDNNNNTSLSYSDSDVLKDKCRTIRLKDADETLDEIFFDALQNNKTTIIDAGGGDDTNRVLEFLGEQSQAQIQYIIPMTPGADGDNVISTFNRIPAKDNVLVILNGYHDIEDLQKEFLEWFGDRSLDIKGIQKQINAPYIAIPFNHFFRISKRYKMTISDLAELSNGLSPEQATEMFMKESEGDAKHYRGLYKKYKISLRAARVLDEIKNNLSGING